MYTTIQHFLEDMGFQVYIKPVSYILTLVVILCICLISRFLFRCFFIKVVSTITKRTKFTWDNILYQNKVFHRTADFIVPIIITLAAKSLPSEGDLLRKTAGILGVAIIVFLLDSLLNSIDEIYRSYEISKLRPIKSFLQVVKVAVFIIGGIIGTAILAGESPLVLLGGIGAMTAVTSFIFKDAILGFVAGIQLTANNMIRIGDWIELPGTSANGTVIELTMTTVRVENFDKTIVSVPAYTLVSQVFINWRGMEASGGRRIKRAIYIDASGVKVCEEEMLKKLKEIDLIREYIDNRRKEIQEYNKEMGVDSAEKVNGRQLTNIGTFRQYITEYLMHHTGIHQDKTIMVRQLDPTEKGIPLEIYAFTNTTEWVKYEAIQSDIFDHLYSIIKVFELEVYQSPSGNDIRFAVKLQSEENMK